MIPCRKVIIFFLATLACLVVIELRMDGWTSNHTVQRNFLLQEVRYDVTVTTIPLNDNTNSSMENSTLSVILKGNQTGNVKRSPVKAEDKTPITIVGTGKEAISQSSPNQNQPKGPGGGGVLSPGQVLRILHSSLAELPPIPSQKVIRILVATYFRSGSTFLGDVLQHNWKTYYHFEPLHFMSNGLRIQDYQTEEAFSLLPDLFRCNFSSPFALKYLKWVSDLKHAFLFKRNAFLWRACRMQPSTCFQPEFPNYMCQRATVQVMKATRLNLDHVLRMVKDNPDLDIRVVHLVRDPRGIISSRKVLDWCNTTSCSDFRVLCEEMVADHRAFKILKDLRPNKAFQIRYEDFSLRPESVIKQLFSSLGLMYSNNVRKFLKVSTKARAVDMNDPYSTRRDSSKTPFKWRKKLKFNEIVKIQSACSDVLETYSYGFIENVKELKGDPPLLPFKN